jgi:hypothetical protein
MPLVRSLLVVCAVALACDAPTRFTIKLNSLTPSDATIVRCVADETGTITRLVNDEPYVATDPTRRDHVVSIWQSRSTAGSVVQWSSSPDGGVTWTTPRAVPINACAGGPLATARRAGDPWVGVGPDGRWYLSAIAFTPGPGGGPDLTNVLVSVTSDDAGRTWQPAVVIAQSAAPEISHDNLAITADPTRRGVVYAATTLAEEPNAQTYFGRLGFARTRDGGRTWEPIRAITPAVNGERIGAPQIVVAPSSGRLFAVYHARASGQARLGVRTSDDQGATWSEEAIAAAHVRGARVTNPADGSRFVLADDIVSAAVDRRTGRVFVAYADAHQSNGQHYDISLIWSDDGRSWSSPIAVSDSAERTAWLPAVAVADDGQVGVMYQSADFTATDRTVRLMLRRFTRTAAVYVRGSAEVVDRGPLGWPGDYQSMVGVRDGFLGLYGWATDIKAAFSASEGR